MSGLEILGAIVLAIVSIFFPRVVLATIIMLLLSWPIGAVVPLAILAFVLDLASCGVIESER